MLNVLFGFVIVLAVAACTFSQFDTVYWTFRKPHGLRTGIRQARARNAAKAQGYTVPYAHLTDDRLIVIKDEDDHTKVGHYVLATKTFEDFSTFSHA